MFTQIIGYIAALLAALIFLPQVIQTIKTKDTKGLSLFSFVLINISNVTWLTYGILTGDSAIMLSQVCILPMGAIILSYKIKYKETEN
jgi:MtN3 and saliva related transmembrane protein